VASDVFSNGDLLTVCNVLIVILVIEQPLRS
jgi:hypothetical protein